MTDFKWTESKTITEPSEPTEYQYKEFRDYFKSIVPMLWNVKEWDNETIKGWLEDAFLSGRDKKI
jgi:hypothetical protein